MILPTIHLNGTHPGTLPGTLAEAYLAAAEALDEALEALREAQPNARDYYLQGDDGFALARSEHVARIRALETIHAEMLQLSEHCADAAATRRVGAAR